MQCYLSFVSGTPIAQIKGGGLSGKTLYITNKRELGSKIKDVEAFLGEDFLQREIDDDGKPLSIKDLKLLVEALKRHSNKRPSKNIKSNHKELYKRALEQLAEAKGREVVLTGDSVFIPIPPDLDKERFTNYTSGISGAGKSTFVSTLADEYKKLYPENYVYLFSMKKEDPVFDEKGIIDRIIIDDDLINEELTLEDFKDSLVIFDDTATLPAKYRDYVDKIKAQLLECGRSQHTSVICTEHLATNGAQTRLVINECTTYTIFPHAVSNKANLERFLKKYCGFSATETRKILDLPSRWVMIKNTHPRYILCETMCYIP
jgi:hypothetical protein